MYSRSGIYYINEKDTIVFFPYGMIYPVEKNKHPEHPVRECLRDERINWPLPYDHRLIRMFTGKVIDPGQDVHFY